MHKKFSISEAVKYGWEGALNHIGFFVMALLAAWVLSLIPSSIADELEKNGLPLLSSIASIIGFLVGSALSLGFIKNTLRMMDGGEPTMDNFLPDWPRYWMFVGASVLVSIAIGLGFVLLIVPGVIALTALGLYGYFMVDKDMRPVEAIKASLAATKGHRWQIFLFWLTSLGILLLGAIALFIGLFVAIPTVMLAWVYIYRKLSDDSAVKVVEGPEVQTV